MPAPSSLRDHNPRRIDALLRDASAPCAGRLHWFGEIASTNDYLMAHEDPHARVCLAELQTAGRGRRGRVWRAPRASSLLLSLGWRLGDVAPSGLSLLAGLAAASALRGLGIAAVGLKWPNDLIARGAPSGKLGGVLTELRGGFCVIGIGMNVRRTEADDGRADLDSLGYELDRDHLAGAVIIALCDYLPRFCAHGFAPFVAEWDGLNVHRDAAAAVESAGETIRGIVRGVDADGALLIESDGVQRRVVSVGASLRGEGL